MIQCDGTEETTNGDLNLFVARLLVATRGACNTGIDSPQVMLVFGDGIPPSVEDFLQELGRAGRRLDASPETDWITICYSLQSYITMIKRIYAKDSDDAESKTSDETRKAREQARKKSNCVLS